MRSALVLPVALMTLLASCGGDASTGSGSGAASTDDAANEAFKALASGQHAEALLSFDRALAGLDPASPEYRELGLARCEALAHVDGPGTVEAMKAMQGVSPKQYGKIAQRLIAASKYEEAVLVMDQGVKAHPNDAEMTKLREDISAAAAKDPAGAKALQGLGYLGDDE